MDKYIKWAAVLALLCAGIGYLYAAFFYKTTYVSKAQLIVLAPKTVNQPKDYASIATSRSSLEWVKGDLGLSDTVEELQSYISATNTAGTNIVALEVTTDDPEKSERIAASLSTSVGGQAKMLFGENNTSVVGAASEAIATGKANPVKSALIGAVAGVFIVGAIAFIFYDPKKEPVKPVRKAFDHQAEEVNEDDRIIASEPKANKKAEDEKPVEIKPVGYKYNYVYSGSKSKDAAEDLNDKPAAKKPARKSSKK